MENSYSKIVKACACEINRLFNSPKEWKDNQKITSIFSVFYQAIYQQIHTYLVKQNTKEAEKEIRDIIAKYVIGYLDKKTKINYIGSINPIKAKIAQIRLSNDTDKEFLERYIDLYDDFMALASFRSYKFYCIYMQDCFGFTLWEDTQNVFEGYWYYANKMVLDGSVKFIEKQLPTGYGKSLSDAFMHSWIFGIDIDNDILKVCGNDKFTDDCFQNVVEKLMLSPKYAKVFPYYAQFNCQKDLMFSFCSRKDLKFSITGSKKSTNFRIVTKLSDTNGVRAKFLFVDDITQRRDMSNLTQHHKDIHSHLRSSNSKQ